MFSANSLDVLAVAHARGHELRADAASERLRGASWLRRALAAVLRLAADELDPAPLARTPASQT